MSKSRLQNLLDKVPHPVALVVIFGMIGIILTWLIPSGEYQRAINPTNNINMVVAGSFKYLPESHPQDLLAFLFSFWNGLFASNAFTVYLFLIGGAMSIIAATGAIDAIVYKAHDLSEKHKGVDLIFIAALAAFFGFCGSTFGMSGETLIFMPILVVLCRSFGLDAIVAVAMSTTMANLGYACATTNAFSLGIAQGIAELPLLSGIEFRVVWALFSMTVTICYILRYCKKIKKNPEESLVADIDYSEFASIKDSEQKVSFTLPRILSLLALLGAIGGVVYGAVVHQFGFKQMSTLFVAAAFVCIIINRMSMNDAALAFSKGAATMVVPILLLGFARSFLMIMQDGMIVDTIVNSLASLLEGLPKTLTVGAMVIFQGILNIFIPAASGQAAITMPLIVPLSDLLEINRQVAVFAFQIGDGVGNIIIPTFGTIMASIAIGKIPYGRWFSFALPLVGIQYALGICAAIIAQLINYGPF